jgi:hypothetical protein
MKTIDEIHRDNLRILIDKWNSVRALAEALEMGEAQLSQWANGSKDSKTGKPRGIRPESLRLIETKLKLERGWLDHDHSLSTPNPFTFSFSKPLSKTTIKVVELMEAMDDETRGAVYGATLMLIKALPQELQERILKVG